MNSLAQNAYQKCKLKVPVRYRPGLRHGVAPEQASTTFDTSKYSHFYQRLHIRLCSGLRERNLQKSHEYLMWQIDTIQALSLPERDKLFVVVKQQVARSGYDKVLLIDALAHICVQAGDTLKLKPRQGQCRAALGLLSGQFVEMPTGEGKTLVTALTASVTALDGSPVHVLTSNEYLAERDATRLEPLYSSLGLTSKFVVSDMTDAAKRVAYESDIVHLTAKQAGFDWMRDKIAIGSDESQLVTQLDALVNTRKQDAPPALQRGLCVGILDEADCILLDEARTPLVIASSLSGDASLEKEASIALGLAQLLSIESDFQLQRDTRNVVLTDIGQANLERISKNVAGVWRVNRFRNQRVCQALAAIHLWRLDHDYIVQNGTVLLVDEQSGRAMPDRRLQHGMQVLLELKEQCTPTPESSTVGSIAFQNFFLRYLRLVGTSGTLTEARSELAHVYKAALMKVEPACPSKLIVHDPLVFATREEQLDALMLEVNNALDNERPVLIGTRSVEQSVGVGALLKAHGITPQILNASQSVDEATLIAAAGNTARVTVATNMAGRGTDIPLGKGVAERGGIHLISLAFNESARVDRQLAGRVARQGDSGSFRQLWTLEDSLLEASMPGAIHGLLKHCLVSRKCSRAVNKVCVWAIKLTQRLLERRFSNQRRQALAENSRLDRHTMLSGRMDNPV